MTPFLAEARARLDKGKAALARKDVPGLPPGYLLAYVERHEARVLEAIRQKLLQRAGRREGGAPEPPCSAPQKVYVAQTRSPVLIERLARWGWGEITQRGELPPQRVPWVYDCAAFKDWQAGRPFDAVQYDRDLWWITNHVERGEVPPPDFIVLPDLPARGQESLALSRSYLDGMNAPPRGFPAPVYLVVQDGMTEADLLPLLPMLGGLFLGGSQAWKNQTLGQWARFAKAHGKGFHVGRGANKETLGLARLHGATSLDSALPLFSEGNLTSFRRDLCHPEVQTTTPGTRIRWRTLRQWLSGWRTIERRQARHISAAGYAAETAHLLALHSRIDLVEGGQDPVLLRELVALLRGRVRKGQATPDRAAARTALLVAAQNRLAQLGEDNAKRPVAHQDLIYQETGAVGSVGRAQARMVDAERLAQAGLFVRRIGRGRLPRWELWGEGARDEARLRSLGGKPAGDRWIFAKDPTASLVTQLKQGRGAAAHPPKESAA